MRTYICPHHPLANHRPVTDGDGLLAALRRCPVDRLACGAFLDYAQDDPARFGAYIDRAASAIPGLTADGVGYTRSEFGPDGALALRDRVRPFAAALAWPATRGPTARPRKSARASTCERLASAFSDEDVAPGRLIAACVRAGYRWRPGRVRTEYRARIDDLLRVVTAANADLRVLAEGALHALGTTGPTGGSGG